MMDISPIIVLVLLTLVGAGLLIFGYKQWSSTRSAIVAVDEAVNALKVDLGRFEGGVQTSVRSLEGQIQSMAQTSASSLEFVRTAVDHKLGQALSESRLGRDELIKAFAEFRPEIVQSVAGLAQETVKSRAALSESAALFEQRIQERFETLTEANSQTLTTLKVDIGSQLTAMSTALREQLTSYGSQQKNQLSTIQESVDQKMTRLIQGSQETAEQLRVTLNERLASIQADNTAKLDEMRRTVDEKLHATLEQRLGQSFKLVSDRLELVHRGLGEMQTLATGVGDLKRVLTNVKTRGVWGEVQLEAMIEQILTPDQYEKNVPTRPGSNERVEIAIRLPGRSSDANVWIPIDAKFPVEDYQRLLDAQERADREQVDAASKALENRIRVEAKTIRDKYLAPPHTVDFAIMYLPIEGLYAEVLRRPGLTETMQRDYRVVISGPTNLAAILNSLQMGFRTLAIEKRSSEVWELLGAVKTEFGKFGDVIAATQKKLEAATNQFSQVGVRTRAIQRKLKDVEATPALEESEAGGLPEFETEE